MATAPVTYDRLPTPVPPTPTLFRLERLPEFDFVAVGVVDPGEAAVGFVLTLRVNFDAFFLEAIEDSVHIVDDVVDHERGLAGREVVGGGREQAPDSHPVFLGVV